MKLLLSLLVIAAAAAVVSAQSGSFYDLKTKTLLGKDGNLAQYRGKVSLVVNVASKCGFTPQYKGLEAVYKKLHPRGLDVLGFPCNQFGAQEPGSEAEIESFCEINYGVTFPLFAKVDVNGDNTAPLYRYLKKAKRGVLGSEAIKWNFTKFLVDSEGHVAAKPLDGEAASHAARLCVRAGTELRPWPCVTPRLSLTAADGVYVTFSA
jgi:glutathione peroxidase